MKVRVPQLYITFFAVSCWSVSCPCLVSGLLTLDESKLAFDSWDGLYPLAYPSHKDDDGSCCQDCL